MRSSRRRLLLAIIAASAFALAGCIPEANRERGGGPGGDIGNWSEEMTMHGDTPGEERMYYETPLMGKGIERSRNDE
jgi:hypothetical protein